MTDKLPPNLLALFAPRPPLRYLTPPDHAPEKRRTQAISGLAAFLPALQAYKETDVYEPTESWLEMRDRKKLERQKDLEALATDAPKNCEISLPPYAVSHFTHNFVSGSLCFYWLLQMNDVS